MPATQATERHAAATLLAIVVAASGRIDDRELAELDRLCAHDRLGIDRGQFLALVHSALEELGESSIPLRSLRLSDHPRLHDLQQAVVAAGLRPLVRRLAAGLIAADGRVKADERLVHPSLLGQWGLSETMVAHAAMLERRH